MLRVSQTRYRRATSPNEGFSLVDETKAVIWVYFLPVIVLVKAVSVAFSMAVGVLDHGKILNGDTAPEKAFW